MVTEISFKRLNREYMQILKNPPPYIIARPLESNILEWHYIITGPPDSPYYNGEYHGVLLFPPEYPYLPPTIKMLTPNGRFKINSRLCLSISDYHPKNWSAAWGVSTILTGLLSFMLEDTNTLGSIYTTVEEKIKFSKKSREYNRNDPTFRFVFPELCDDSEQPIQTEKLYVITEEIEKENPPFEMNNENVEEQNPLVENENIEEQNPIVGNENVEEQNSLVENENVEEQNSLVENENVEEQNSLVENENVEEQNSLVENENVEEQNSLVENENVEEQNSLVENENVEEQNSLVEMDNENVEEPNPPIENENNELNNRRVRIIEPERDKRRDKPKRSHRNHSIVKPGCEQSTFLIVLSRRGIREFPPDVLRSVNLRRLMLNGNLLTTLPHSITFLKNLRYINLSANCIKEFPSVLCKMERLEILDISKNEIENLPEDFGQLENTLEGFDISNNKLKRIPFCIGRMTELKLLKIDHNPLEYPPFDITLLLPERSRDQWLIQLKNFLNDNAPLDGENIYDSDSDPDSDPDFALALERSLEEENMRQEATYSGSILNDEDYMLAKAIALSMDDNINNKVDNMDEDEAIKRAIALSLAEDNLNINK